MKPLVAIVGRPNVGKSTLFNKLVGQRLAIVEDLPGTTRDRLYADAEWNGRIFTVIDTGGLELGASDDITVRIGAQAQLAIEEADVIVLMVDSRDGITEADARSPSCCAARASQSCSARTRPTTPRGGRRPSSSTRWGWASRSRSPRSLAREPATCSTRSPICCRRPWMRTTTSRCPARRVSPSSDAPTSASRPWSTPSSGRSASSSATSPARRATPSTPSSSTKASRSC